MAGRRRNMEDLQGEIQELFADLWQVPGFSGLRHGFRPQCDCFRTEDPPALHVVLELPGMDPSSVDIAVSGRSRVPATTKERPETAMSTLLGSIPGSSRTTWSAGGSSVRKQSHCGRKPWRSPEKPGTCQRSAKSSWISPWRSSMFLRLPAIAPAFPDWATVKSHGAPAQARARLARARALHVVRRRPEPTAREAAQGRAPRDLLGAREHGRGEALRRGVDHVPVDEHRAVLQIGRASCRE